MKGLLIEIRLLIIRIFLTWMIPLAPRNHPEGAIVLRGVMNMSGEWAAYRTKEAK